MKSFPQLLFLSVLCTTATMAPAAEPSVSSLEAKLARTVDTTAEGAVVLLELIDFHRAKALIPGLTRHAKRFTDAHLGHARHSDILSLLVQGLRISSRHNELIAASRQFLEHYSDDARQLEVSEALQESLRLIGRKRDAADAGYAAWQRAGIKAYDLAVSSMHFYREADQKDGWKRSAEIATGLLAGLTANHKAYELGMEGFYAARHRAGEPELAAQIGKLMLDKKIPFPPEELKPFLLDLAENSRGMNKPNEQIPLLEKAWKLADDPEILAALVEAHHQAKSDPEKLQPLVSDFRKKFPDHKFHWSVVASLAEAQGRAGQTAKALETSLEVLRNDVDAGDSLLEAGKFLAWAGGKEKPESFTNAEQLIRGLIDKKPRGAWRLAWVLAFDLHRDRLQKPEKAKEWVRAMLFQFQPEETSVASGLDWLLDSATSDADFQKDLDQWLKTAQQRLDIKIYREHLASYAKVRSEKPGTKARAKLAEQIAKKLAETPLFKQWAKSQTEGSGRQGREELLGQTLPAPQMAALLRKQAESFASEGNENGNRKAAESFRQLVKLDPNDAPAVRSWLYFAAGGAEKEERSAAAAAVLAQSPVRDSYTWLALMTVAKKNQDPQLARSSLAWIEKAEKANGATMSNAGEIGGILKEMDLKTEAMAWCEAHFLIAPSHLQSSACAQIIWSLLPEKSDGRVAFARKAMDLNSSFFGTYATWLADEYLKRQDFANFTATIQDAVKRRPERPISGWGLGEYPTRSWLEWALTEKELTEENKQIVFAAVRDLKVGAVSEKAALLSTPLADAWQRLQLWQQAAAKSWNQGETWNHLRPLAQSALTRGEFAEAGTLFASLVANITQVDAATLESGRAGLRSAYARLGVVGFDAKAGGPAAPVLAIATHLQMGEQTLAARAYKEHQALFDKYFLDLPVEVILFAAGQHMNAGTEAEHNRTEDLLRQWLIKYSEKEDIPTTDKSRIQLLLAKNYDLAGRWEAARSEYTTVENRYPKTPEAIEARFGIAETFLAQKVYDQAGSLLEALAQSPQTGITVRADFLRGVLASRKGERDEARRCFRAVLDRVPDIEMADRTLFELSQVYGYEQRYLEQLDLLRTVGRLGRESQKWQTPGKALSIVVQDADLGISRGEMRLPVLVKASPGGDQETVWLRYGGGGRGLFMGEISTALGAAASEDHTLQVQGSDIITVDYPPDFKSRFASMGLPRNEIAIASDAKFMLGSAPLVAAQRESISSELSRANNAASQRDQRQSVRRPGNEIKPGNMIYARVVDPDRDRSGAVDSLPVVLTASSGDVVRINLTESGPHTGEFLGVAKTGELPAGAVASDQAIGRSPLLAIDQSTDTAWLSEPDGLAPKSLTVDLKALRPVDTISLSTPEPTKQTLTKFTLQGSRDGRFFYQLGSFPTPKPPTLPKFASGAMTRRVWKLDRGEFENWEQLVDWTAKHEATETKPAEQLAWKLEGETAAKDESSYGVMWTGAFLQPRPGAVRFAVEGQQVALLVNGRVELWTKPAQNAVASPAVDVWLPRGAHQLCIFAITKTGSKGIAVQRARENPNVSAVRLLPFTADDFALDFPEAKDLQAIAATANPAAITEKDGTWTCTLPESPLRHVRCVIEAYKGEAVAINHCTIKGGTETWIPTAIDILALGKNDILELAAGDSATGKYVDEITEEGGIENRELTQTLTATYFDGRITPISMDFGRAGDGTVSEKRQELRRIDPGDRVSVEIADFDLDQSGQIDTVKVSLQVADASPVILEAAETGPTTGIFRVSMDTAEVPAEGKLVVKRGQRLRFSYFDDQNNFPGHRHAREAEVLVRTPGNGRLRLVESRMIPPPVSLDGKMPTAPPQYAYVPFSEDRREAMKGLCYDLPLSVEVIDPDAAKTTGSRVIVTLERGDEPPLRLACVLSDQIGGFAGTNPDDPNPALGEGRFIGQIPLQMGGVGSPAGIPKSAERPGSFLGEILPETPEGETPAKPRDDLMPVLNLTGSTAVVAKYEDAERTDGAAKTLSDQGQLIGEGTLGITDDGYTEPVASVRLGNRLYLRLNDPDADKSDNRDKATLIVSNEQGEEESVTVEETLSHSGIFTGSFALKASEKPTRGNHKAQSDPAIEGFFGSKLSVAYLDDRPASQDGQLVVKSEVAVADGSDGRLASFSKIFDEEELAVQTQFTIAESHFELFKSHLALKREAPAAVELAAGRKVLQELSQDYPGSKYAARISYLTGQFAQEMKDWPAAIAAYQSIIREAADHTLAADAQFKLGQCHEAAQQPDEAMEAYVTLAARYPKSPLIANAMVRMNDHFYGKEEFKVAAQVGSKFLERFPTHQWAPKIAFRIGQCNYKGKEFKSGGQAFDLLVKQFPDDELTSQALFWAGECYRGANDVPNAFRRYNRCRWDFPETEAAKFARGRLALPEMLAQFERESNVDEDSP